MEKCYYTKTSVKQYPDNKDPNKNEEIKCLIVLKSDLNHKGGPLVTPATWNSYHKCWDDFEGDDFMHDQDEVEAWMIVPEYIP